jgi:membrane protein DedA with SNARE-associated domain
VRIELTIFFATLSTVVLPVPEEATLLAAGYAVRLGRTSLVAGALAAWLAVMIGDTIAYFVGRALLARALRTRAGRALLPEARRAWAEELVAGHGARAIVLGRFFVGVRGFIYFAVGASRFPFARFLAVDSAAGVVEVGGLVAVGFGLGELRVRVGTGIDLAAAAVLLAAFFGPLLVRLVRRRRGAQPAVR